MMHNHHGPNMFQELEAIQRSAYNVASWIALRKWNSRSALITSGPDHQLVFLVPWLGRRRSSVTRTEAFLHLEHQLVVIESAWSLPMVESNPIHPSDVKLVIELLVVV